MQKPLAILTVIIIAVSTGTIWYYLQNNQTLSKPNNSPTPTPSNTQSPSTFPSQTTSPKVTQKPTTSITSTASPSPSPIPTPTIAPVDLWWQTNWSNNNATLNIIYNQIEDLPQPTQTNHVHTEYLPNGAFYYRTITTSYQGEDSYGRLTNTTKTTISYSPSGTFYLSPNPPTAYGSLLYPASSSIEQSQFARNFTSITTYNNYSPPNTPGEGTYKEEFSGHITTSVGEITFVGNVTAPLTWDINQAFVNRTEKTSYSLNGKPYAETTLTTTWESSYINGAYRITRENDVTETYFADGDYRKSQITTSYQRDENGTITGKSSTGTVSGIDQIGTQSINYTGAINITFSSNQAGAWIKTSYHENRTAVSRLQRVPFEALFIEDPQLNPMFQAYM